ncbi:specifically androgen-regulated gene protein [Astyanax mexicanus]|uniref:specifically androgen-regulated gene protein n=1 Tax=Astyanax mexicanus TaxID=7994 RepID=UPI0020CAEA91|nr:specifically androgen-regulated gene protein [Astyanax mexicanus]XP_007251456.3 specifically androgen-regulated gene protein [Astyanax mexicanus]
MPKSDTWPGSIGKETIGEMDSADSCDSVLSSYFSDDSLQYLSAEEKACLMFLEETIDALDTDDDSGLSNDEAENLPARGNVATKTACLSASMNQIKQKDIPKHYVDDPSMYGSSEHNQILNYLVPTPFVLANGSPHSPPKPGPPAFKEKPSPKEVTKVHKSNKEVPHVPSEVNVVVIPPPLMGKTNNAKDQGLQIDRTPRGPLTYEGLVQLRKKVSSRKNTDSERQPSTHQDLVFTKNGAQVISQNIQPNRIQPPAVAPKPKKMPSNIAVLNHKGTTDANGDSCLSTSPGSGGLMKPEKVRLEALSKLGLLKESDAKPSSSSVPDLSQSRPAPPCAALRSQELRNQSNQGSNVPHHRSLSDLTVGPSRLQQHNIKSAVGKAATLDRSGMGLGSSPSTGGDLSNKLVSQNHLQCSSTKVGKNNLGNIQRGTTVPSSPGKTTIKQSSTVPPVTNNLLHAPGLNVVRVPNMGEDRREALRKLGLLKN